MSPAGKMIPGAGPQDPGPRADYLKDSAIVCAHPDDEVLWFSSVIESVDAVILCFLECPSRPLWTEGRIRSIEDYPLKTVSCLGVVESEAFDGADWEKPVLTEYGIDIRKKDDKYNNRYKENYFRLKELLRPRLSGLRNVFTHNPWGEYAHEEHIQVYRAVRDLQKEFGFALWFSGYFSKKSERLMRCMLKLYDGPHITLETNRGKAEAVKRVYSENNCWTWNEDWEWFGKESFKRVDADSDATSGNAGRFPVNRIKFKRKKSIFKALLGRVGLG